MAELMCFGVQTQFEFASAIRLHTRGESSSTKQACPTLKNSTCHQARTRSRRATAATSTAQALTPAATSRTPRCDVRRKCAAKATDPRCAHSLGTRGFGGSGSVTGKGAVRGATVRDSFELVVSAFALRGTSFLAQSENEFAPDDDDFAPKRAKRAGQASAAAARKTSLSSTKSAKSADGDAAASPAPAKAKRGRPKGSSASVASSSSGGRGAKARGTASVAASAAAAGKGAISEKTAPSVVLEYMNTQNRPYSLINVFDNLHGAVKKAALGRVLDALAASGSLKEKAYGKAKIYWPDQAQYGEISDDVVAEMRGKVAALTAETNTAAGARRDAEGNVARLKSLPATGELQAQVAEAEARVAALRARLAACEAAAEEREEAEASGGAAASAKAAPKRPPLVRGKGKKELEALLAKFLKVWKQRRRMVIDVAGQIEEGSGMKMKVIMEKAGMESDKEAGAPDPRDM